MRGGISREPQHVGSRRVTGKRIGRVSPPVWDSTRSRAEVRRTEARRAVADAERIIEEARASGCAISRKVDGVHVIDRKPFDPDAEEYQIIAPIAGG